MEYSTIRDALASGDTNFVVKNVLYERANTPGVGYRKVNRTQYIDTIKPTTGNTSISMDSLTLGSLTLSTGTGERAGVATLVDGEVVVSIPGLDATLDHAFVSYTGDLTNPGYLTATITENTLTITSSDITDVSDVTYAVFRMTT